MTTAAANLACSQSSGKVLSNAIFQAEGGQFSLGSFDSLTKERDWTSHGSVSYPAMGFGSKALLNTEGDADKLAAAWVSLLFAQGTVVKHNSSRSLYFVINSTHLGVYLWRVSSESEMGTLRIIFTATPGQQPVVFEMVDDQTGWVSVALVAAPPLSAPRRVGKSGADSQSIAFRTEGKAEPVAVHSARLGFLGVTSHFLNKLYTQMRIKTKGRRLASDAALTRALVQALLPGLSPQEVERIVGLRKAKPSKEPSDSVLLDVHCSHVSADLLDADAKLALSKWQESRGLHPSYLDKAEAGESIAKLVSKASSSKADGSGRIKVSLTGSHTPEWAMALLLVGVTGCGVKCDTTRHMRWQTFYPCETPPRSWSRSWGSGHTSDQCLMYCLREVWAAHTRATGEQCPFDLTTEEATSA